MFLKLLFLNLIYFIIYVGVFWVFLEIVTIYKFIYLFNDEQHIFTNSYIILEIFFEK